MRRSRQGAGGRARWQGKAAVIALLILGVALRLPGIGTVPPGLYHDEAQHGLDALTVLEGRRSGDGAQPGRTSGQGRWVSRFYFAANNGREPLYIYFVTAAVAVLGRTPLAIRLPACFAGVLTLAATYDLARTLWDRKCGLWALAVLAVTFWHVHLSRVGFRAVLLPLVAALAASQLAKGIRHHRRRNWVAGGALYGIAWYTYSAVRFSPVVLGCLLVYGLSFHPRILRRQWLNALLAGAVALFVLLPLGLYTLTNPDVVLARTGQVSIFNETIHGGHFWRTAASHLVRTAGMFTVRGDRIWRHNLAWRPVWGAGLGVAFLVGLGVALATFRRDAGAAVALVWTAVMALPTVLAEDAPHFLRAVGVLPAAALLPVLGLRQLECVGARKDGGGAISLRWSVSRLPAILWLIGLSLTTYDYFVRFDGAPLAYHWFEGGPVALAGQVNAFREEGYVGSGMRRQQESAPSGGDAPRGRDVFIDRDIWESWSSLPYLVPEEAVVLFPDDETVPAHLGGTEDPDSAAASRSLLAVWPHRDWSTDVHPLLPHPAYLQVRMGPQAQGDLDPEPFTIAVIVQVGPRPAVPEPIATLDGGIVLRAALVEVEGESATALLWWETHTPPTIDYTVFVHYERDGVRIAQHDGQPGYGFFPTTTWKAGDLLLDRHPLPGVAPDPSHDQLRIGMYTTSMPDERAGSVGLGDAVTVPVVPVAP